MLGKKKKHNVYFLLAGRCPAVAPATGTLLLTQVYTDTYYVNIQVRFTLLVQARSLFVVLCTSTMYYVHSTTGTRVELLRYIIID